MEEKKIVIAERDNIAAVVEGKKVQEFFVTRGDILLGDIYLATVENILPSIEAAFVNVGSDKMGFLHTEDVLGKGALKDKLSPKQKVVVQVVKEPVGHKGPRVTMEISLPGRFLVLLPNETGVNVSRKIEGVKERARLKSIVNLLKPVGVGVIVRTEAEGQTEADIQEDLELLLEKWNNIVTTAEAVNPPNLISRDQDLLYRTLREACTEEISEIIVDTPFAMNRVQQLLQNWHMNKNVKVNLYKGVEPLLIATDIHKEIKAALQTKVNMPSGGYLYIQNTEALTVIDVNSGKFTSSATQDETIFKTNKEAVHEIARQLRLRNIGGMVIVDFIDMTSRVDKLAILEEFEIALEPDKAKPQIGQISDLGLVELTRHRQGQSISELFSKKCPHCQGSGYTMEEFKFAAPVAEGEMRAKAQKAKSPMMNFKKNDEQAEKQENNQKKNRKNNKFNKNKHRQNEQAQEVQDVQELIEQKPI
ncbi:Rne/Rng family ribonuclease, partial [bacterium]|nr:Rne/Rng family ribonuclease [bacterium]